VDINQKYVDKALKKELKLILMDAENLDFPDNSFALYYYLKC
jgi:ubiquinone/menaquinone biosynthesis C-methylase UbiE